MHEEYDVKYVRIAKPVTARLVGKREVTFTCQRCKQQVTQWRFPGPTPKYCETCQPIVQREKTRARVKRVRDRRQGKASEVPRQPVLRFQVIGGPGAWRVIDTEILTKLDHHPYTVRWIPEEQEARRYAQELNQTRGHTSDEPKCSICGTQPAGGEPPCCASCHSRLADLHG